MRKVKLKRDERIRLDKLMAAYKIEEKKAIEMIKNTASSQEGLPLLSQLASLYISVSGEESSKVAAVKSDERLKTLMESYKIKEEDTAIEMIKKLATEQVNNGERSKLTNKLAQVFNEAGGVEAGNTAITAVTSNEQFNTFKALVGTEEDAITAIKKVAKETDTTWWTNYNEVVERLNDANDDSVLKITVEDNGHDVEVLYVKSRTKEDGNNDRNSLYNWWAEQVNFRGSLDNRANNNYAVQAWKMEGSLYYLALKKLGASFDDNLNKGAAEKNRKKLASDMAARSGDGLEISRSIQSTGNVRIRRKTNHI